MEGFWIKYTTGLFLIYTYCVFKFVYSMPKVRESHLKMSVFSVANMVTGKYIQCVCLVHEICLASQPFITVRFLQNSAQDTNHFDSGDLFHQEILHVHKDFK